MAQARLRALKAVARCSAQGGGRELVVGIIDLTQDWTLKTKLARVKKSIECRVQCKDPLGISTLPVDLYQERFMRFMRQIFDETAAPHAPTAPGVTRFRSEPAGTKASGTQPNPLSRFGSRIGLL